MNTANNSENKNPDDGQGVITLGEAILMARYGKAARWPTCQTKIAIAQTEEMLNSFQQKLEQLISLSDSAALLYKWAARHGQGNMASKVYIVKAEADVRAIRVANIVADLQIRLLSLQKRFKAQLSAATQAERRALQRLSLKPNDDNLKLRLLETLRDAVLAPWADREGRVSWGVVYRILDLPLSDSIFQDRIAPGDVAPPSENIMVRRNAAGLGIELIREQRHDDSSPRRYLSKRRRPNPDALSKSLVRIGDGADEWNGDEVSFKNYCYQDDPEIEFDRYGREIESEPRRWGHIGLPKLLRGLRYKKGILGPN
jgi:hypothetical protein